MYLLSFKGTALWKTEKRLISGRKYLTADLWCHQEISNIFVFSLDIRGSWRHVHIRMCLCATWDSGQLHKNVMGRWLYLRRSAHTWFQTPINLSQLRSIPVQTQTCLQPLFSQWGPHVTFSFLPFCSGAAWFKGLIFHVESPLLESSAAPSTKHEKPNIDEIKIIMQWHIF